MVPRRLPPRRRRHAPSVTARSLVAFLLVASLGILFAGCHPQKGPSTGLGAGEEEEFVFTEEDRERMSELSAGTGVQVGTGGGIPRLEVLDAMEGEETVLDLSMIPQYQAIRSGPGASGEDLYRVVHPFLNIRSAPKVTAPLTVRLERGALVKLKEFVDAAWAHVEVLPGGEEGYVAQRYIAKLVSEEDLPKEKKEFEGLTFVDFTFLNVRKEPDTESEKIGELPGQAFVRPISEDSVWARIPFEGKEGYVAREYLSPFLPNFLVRQERYVLPVLHYRLREEGILDVLPRHLERLREAGVKVWTFRDFRDLVLRQEERDVRLEPKTVLLAFSEVTPENLKGVSDALRGSNIRATVFLQTRDVGLSGITEKAILTLIANGLDIQSAGHTGDDLRSLTNAQMELELAQSRKILEEFTGKGVFAVVYPGGGVNDRVMQQAGEAGYLFGVSLEEDRTFERSQFLRLPSFQVSAATSADEVVKIALGEK